MPLEISEIGVHVAVGPSVAPQGPSVPHAPEGGESDGGAALTPAQHEAIVNACVEQVMRNLKQMQAR